MDDPFLAEGQPRAEQGRITDQGYAEQNKTSSPFIGSPSEVAAETPPDNATTRLRAFEDDTLGEDAVRIHGRIERGSGSHYQTKLTHEQRMQHVALEKMIEAEQKVADTSVALENAKIAHEAAKKHVEACEADSKKADAERDRKAKLAIERQQKREHELGSEQHV
jgi:hypothetical protein